LAYTLGIKQMTVLVNKMDDKNVNFSEERFNEIKSEILVYLKKVGYNPDKIRCIPISGWTGDNITKPSPNMPWYKGHTLLESLDDMEPPLRPTHLALRLPL
jgi:elongation factor 1-alpha